jgi:hypothetical protein
MEAHRQKYVPQFAPVDEPAKQTPYRHRLTGGSVQQGLSVAGDVRDSHQFGRATDKRYSLDLTEESAMRITLFLFIACFPGLSSAKTPWPENFKTKNIAQCTERMTIMGLSKETASSYCSCLVNAMEKEFGVEDYVPMAQAKPNPKGSENDRKLESIISECKEKTRPQLAQ